MKNFYIFGLQRSGTNYLQKLITSNFECFHNNSKKHTWKHSTTLHGSDRFLPDSFFLTIHKNPYTWVESLCNRNNVDWEINQTQYDVNEQVDGMMAGRHNYNVIPLAQAYYDFHTTWITNRPGYIKDFNYIMKYEDLLYDDRRENILSEIKSRFNLNQYSRNRDEHGFNNVDVGRVSQSKDMDVKRIDYYKQQKPEILTQKQIDAITNTITPTLIRSLGYDIL